MPRDPRAYLQRAEEHRRHGRLKEAIALSIEALGKHPGLDAVRVTLGRAYLENAQPEEARATLQEIFGRLPEHHLAGKLLVESQRLLGDLAGATATCRTLLEHYPRDREIEPILAEVLRAQSAPAPDAPGAPPAAIASFGTKPAVAPAAAGPTAAAPPAPDDLDLAPDYLPEDVGSSRETALPAPPVAAVASVVKPEPVPAPVKAAEPPAPPQPMPLPPPVMPVASAASTPVPVVAAPPAAPPMVAAAPVVAATPVPTAPGAGAGAGEARRDALETNTLAELYVKQGLPDRAIDVYRSMLRVEPGNAAAKRRLAEIEAALAGAAAPAPRSPAGSSSASSPPSRPATAAAAPTRSTAPAVPGPAPAPPAPSAPIAALRNAASPDRSSIERLERWLDALKRGQDRRGGGAAA